MKIDYVHKELISRKPYLLEDNFCPNVGLFEYGKSENVDKVLYGANVYRYDIYNYRDDEDRIKNLGGGDPIQFKTYKYINKDINSYLKKNKLNDYPHTSGDEEVKNKLIDYLKSIGISDVNEEELLITASTTHGYSLILKSIIRPHDVVIIPTPTYGLFVYEPEKIGGRVEFIELHEDKNWKLDLKEFEDLIIKINKDLKNKYKDLGYTPRVVSIYHQNPNNPLGITYSKKDKKYLKDFLKICEKYKLLVIDDLVYRDSVYDLDDISIPLASFKEYKDGVISLFGISKSFSLAALRTGFIYGNKYIIQDIRDSLFIQMDSISMLSQIALSSVFNNDTNRVEYREKFLSKIKQKYLDNLDIIKFFVNGENDISSRNKRRIKRLLKGNYNKYKGGNKDVSIYHNLIPKSGFFILLDFSKFKGKKINRKLIKNDIDFLIEIYKCSKIKFLPGNSFAWNNTDDIIGRITFSKPFETLLFDFKSLMDVLNSFK